MTTLIRNMGDLVERLRCAQIERSISYETIEQITGMASGSVAKYLAPQPSKNLGPMSTFDIAFGVGKALALVDDVETIKVVREHWKKRHRTGGASMQLAKRQEVPEKSEQVDIFEGHQNRMKLIGSIGGEMSGKTRQRKAMRRRELQRKRSHAARLRWAKRSNG